MIITRSGRFVSNDGGSKPQNVRDGDAPFTIYKVRLMIQTMLDQQ